MTRVIEALQAILFNRIAVAPPRVVHFNQVTAERPTPFESATALRLLADHVEQRTDSIAVQRITMGPRAEQGSVKYQSLTVWFSTDESAADTADNP